MLRKDLITSVFLMILGLVIVEESWRMPRFTEVGSSIWAAPGMVPGMLGAALVVLAVILFARTVAARRAGAVDDAPAEPGAWRRMMTAVVFCIVYAGVLVGRMPFWLATFLFAFVFIAAFELSDPQKRVSWARHVVFALVIAALASGIISYIFENIFFVRLP